MTSGAVRCYVGLMFVSGHVETLKNGAPNLFGIIGACGEIKGVRNQICSRSVGCGHVADATTSEEQLKTGGSGTRLAPVGWLGQSGTPEEINADGLLEHGLKVRLRGLQSIMVRRRPHTRWMVIR